MLNLPLYHSTLAVHNAVPEKGNHTQLDEFKMQGALMDCPRVDSCTRCIYVPCSRRSGELDVGNVWVFRWDDNCLKIVKPLKCVTHVCSVAVNTTSTVFVCDDTSNYVYLVDVIEDIVLQTFTKPSPLEKYLIPHRVSALGGNVLVCYDENRLVLYRKSDRGRELEMKLRTVSSIATDGHANFLVISGSTIHVLDDRGNLCRIIHLDNINVTDCAVVQSELWMSRSFGRIRVMMSP